MADNVQGNHMTIDDGDIACAGSVETTGQPDLVREAPWPTRSSEPVPPDSSNGDSSTGAHPPSWIRESVPEVPDSRRAGSSSGQPVDGLALWDSEGGNEPAAGLATVRIDQNERLIVPFTTTMLRAMLHYVDFAALKGYVRCNGPDCLLCRVGRQRDVRDLLPVYDVLDKAVAVLPISPSLRPHALRPQLTPALRRLAGGEAPLLIALRKDGTARFLVATLPLPEGADDGAAVIGAFRERFDAGLADLASPFQRLADEDLATIDEVKALMAAKGIAL